MQDEHLGANVPQRGAAQPGWDTPTLKGMPIDASLFEDPLADTVEHPRVAPTMERPHVAVAVAEHPASAVPATVATPRRTWRGISTVVAVALFVLANVVVQLHRRPLDVAGDPIYGLRRVQACESLGGVPDVLYLGSSRTIFSGDAQLVDDWVRLHAGKTILGCNVGTFSSTIAQDYYTLKRLIADGYAPKMVVETLWEYNLNLNAVGNDAAHGYSAADVNDLNTRQIMNLADLADAPDLTAQLSHLSKDALPEFVAGKLIPVYGARAGLLISACGPTKVGPCGRATAQLDSETINRYAVADGLGWVGTTNSLATLSPQRYANHYQVYSNIATGIANFQIGGHQPEYLARLVALAQAHHIQLVFTSPPIHPFLYEYLTHPSDWQTSIDYWQRFAIQQGVPYYDLSRASGYGDADFVDPQHLSAAGAVKYATWLAQNVIGPLVAQGG